VAGRVQQGARERRLAGAEVAVQVDDEAGRERARQGGAQRPGSPIRPAGKL
jgi:hypothetical protein